MTASGLQADLSALIAVENDFDAVNKAYLERGWTDGLPIVPPTAARVEEMLAYCDVPWNTVVAKVAPRFGEATPVRIAANAVMAGCRPEYFPVVMHALQAMAENEFNLYAIQATTHLCAPLVIVNGPIARQLNINAGTNAFGSGAQANAAMGRAIRLALVNIGGGLPGLGDMATFGAPSKYSYLVAENEAETPWDPLHVERGFAGSTSTVTVIGCECPRNVNDHESVGAKGLLKMIAGTMISTGSNDTFYAATPLVVFAPEHARTVAGDGLSKADVRQILFEQARLPLDRFSPEIIEGRLRKAMRDRCGLNDDTTDVPMVRRPEDIMIAVIGGPGKHSAYFPPFSTTLAITRPLLRASGEIADSIEAFRQH